ncbi:MAG: hypothetical protein H6765_02345 [Candidatus Peribacteria bacterium]|nr:MAG: hypothetical protein H6765_02345 [Candidatus Peribacteria bacterium]
MKPFFQAGGVERYHQTAASQEVLDDIIQTFDLHEIIEEDINEPSTQDKIDVYDQCLFVVLHFPKYNVDRRKYLVNELNIILTKTQIITLSKYQSNHIEQIKEDFEEHIELIEKEQRYKLSSYYILYKIVDVMYDKVIRGSRLFARDLSKIEDLIFERESLDRALLEEIMIKRRNVVALKHTLRPQTEILAELQEETLKFFGGEFDVYFEDLQYKLDKIISNLNIIKEDVESIYDTYNAIVNMKINSIITVLTVFTAVI